MPYLDVRTWCLLPFLAGLRYTYAFGSTTALAEGDMVAPILLCHQHTLTYNPRTGSAERIPSSFQTVLIPANMGCCSSLEEKGASAGQSDNGIGVREEDINPHL